MKSARRLAIKDIAATASAVLVIVLGPALAATGPAAQATVVSGPTLTWSGPIRLATDGLSGFLNAVDCPSATQCTAVDIFGREVTYDPTAPGTPVPYTLDSGVDYVAVACVSMTECVAITDLGRAVMFNPVSPAGATPRSVASAAVRALACPSATQCTAVDNAGREVTFDPTTSASPTTATIDSGKQLNGVSCPSTAQCVAVDNGGKELTFDPTSPGSPTPTTVDSGASMNGVFCLASVSQCTAVDNLNQEVTFDPTNVGTPTPAKVDTSVMTDIVCPSATRCVAIDTAHVQVTFDPSNPATVNKVTVGATYYLSGVACPSTAQCTIVDGAGRTATFDAAATSTPTLTLISGRRSLRGVSCPTTTQCTADDDSGRVVTFDPASPPSAPTLTAVTAPNGTQLHGIACPSTTQCTAVDHNSTEVTFNPATPGTKTTSSMGIGQPTGVACPSTTLCIAVAITGERSTFNPQSASPIPESVDYPQSPLAVACPSTTQCEMVDDAGRYVTFAPSPPPGTFYTPVTIDSGQQLTGVACPSTTQCVAVDWIGNEVMFSPTGASSTTIPFVDTGKVFRAVTCASVHLCVSVDNAGRVIEGDLTDAAHWYVQTLPQAVDAQSVSCPSTTECVATDAMGNAFLGLALPENVTLPTVAGTATQGQLLTETNGSWTNSPTGYAYQWEDCDGTGASCAAIDGATNATYTLQPSDVGHTIRAVETASNAVGSGTAAASAHTAVVLPLPPVNNNPPTISGNTSQGQMLTEGVGSWTNNPTSYAYQWEDCDSSGASCAAIDGATDSTYSLQASDVGKTIRVTEVATNAGGSSDPALSAHTAVVSPPDTTAPAVYFLTKPANPTKTRSAQFAFDATDASPPVTFTCQLDSGPATVCASPVSVAGPLADGVHSFAVVATDAASNAAPATVYQWRVDGTAPTAALRTPTAPFVLTTTVTVSWSGADSGSGVGSYNVRYERAPWNGAWGAWTYPTSWHALHVTSFAPSLPIGYTYCFSVQTVDKAGNVSAWTASKCTARPLDDRSETPSAGWVRGTSSGYYLSTYTQTTRLSATLTRTSARLDRVGIVATKCAMCGVVAVYVGNTLVGKISLYSATTARKALIVLPRFSLRTATITLRVLTSGKLIQIDGLAISAA